MLPCARAAALIGLLLLAPAVAGAQAQPERRLRAVEEDLRQNRLRQAEAEREAETLAAEIGQLRIESVDAARALHENESALSRLEERLAGLLAAEQGMVAALADSRAANERLLIALQRVARHPPEALALSPAAPLDTVRGGILLAAAVPALRSRAERLESELAELAALRADAAQTRAETDARLAALAAEQKRMAELVQRKAALQARIAQRVDVGQQRLARLSAQANDLRDLIARLEAERKERDADLLARAMVRPPREALAPRGSGKPLSASKGALVAPVAGRVARRWGEPDEVGAPSRGLLLASRASAQAVAPWDGQVEFAGPFRGYGRILIIEHGDGYHSLLAGLERIDVAVGQALVAGEPVGIVASAEGKPNLYLELRRHGQPIDPLPWLSLRDEKVTR